MECRVRSTVIKHTAEHVTFWPQPVGSLPLAQNAWHCTSVFTQHVAKCHSPVRAAGAHALSICQPGNSPPGRPARPWPDVREPGLTTCVAHTSMALRKYLHPVAVTSSSSELPDADLERLRLCNILAD